MMHLQLLPCPACQRTIPLVERVDSHARLRCPYCAAEFDYDELPSLPVVSWQVISQPLAEPAGEEAPPGAKTVEMADPSAQTVYDLWGQYEQELDPEADSSASMDGSVAGSSVTDTVVAADAPDPGQPTAAEQQIATDPAGEGQPAAEDEPAPAEEQPRMDWNAYPLLTPAGYERQRRQQRSPVWSIIQVVAGGVAAVPIALLLIWHVIGTDVGDAGPWVGQYAPWLVPERYRPLEPPPANWGGDDWSQPPALPSDAAVDARVEDYPPTAPPVDTTPPADTTPLVDTAQPEVAPPPADTASQLAEPTHAEHTPLVDNTLALIRQATEHLQQWAEAAEQRQVDLRSLAQSTYRELADLALALERLPADETVQLAVREELNALGRLVQEEAEVRRLIVEGGRYWVATGGGQAADAASARYGLAMIVVAEGAEEEAAMWRLQATAASRLGTPPLELRLPAAVASGLGASGPQPQMPLFLMGVVTVPTNSADTPEPAAPQSPQFVANYAAGL